MALLHPQHGGRDGATLETIRERVSAAFEQPSVELFLDASFVDPPASSRFASLLDLLGVSRSSEVAVGWYAGLNRVSELTAAMGGRHLGPLVLDPQSDLNWDLSIALVERVMAACYEFGSLPGLVVPTKGGQWLLENPPSSPNSYLYPLP